MDNEEDNPVKGILIGILLSIPVWILLYWLIRRVS